MAKLKWGDLPPAYDRGVDHGVLYLDDRAVPWNGLVHMDDRDTGDIDVEHYYDGQRIHITQNLGNFEGTISAYTYPDEFAEYNGYSDKKTYKRFGLSYRTQEEDIYRIHLVYNVLVDDTKRSWVTDSGHPSPSVFEWPIFGSSISVPWARFSSRLILDSVGNPNALQQVEDILYGTDSTEPRLPDPWEIVEIYEATTLFRVTYNGDGTYTVKGTDEAVTILEDGEFAMTAPSVYSMGKGRFTAHSY